MRAAAVNRYHSRLGTCRHAPLASAGFHLELRDDEAVSGDTLAGAMWQRVLELKLQRERASAGAAAAAAGGLDDAWHQVRLCSVHLLELYRGFVAERGPFPFVYTGRAPPPHDVVGLLL